MSTFLSHPDPTTPVPRPPAALEVAREDLVDEVRRLLASARGDYQSPESIAQLLGLSTRSLRRALQRAGTSYLKLLDETRRRHALDYACTPQLPAEQIAGALGFSDARSFRRAFKRWTGRSLRDYRRSLTARPEALGLADAGDNSRLTANESRAP